ncbi:MAG: WYL domain-containing protein [Terriglobia bacterium]
MELIIILVALIIFLLIPHVLRGYRQDTLSKPSTRSPSFSAKPLPPMTKPTKREVTFDDECRLAGARQRIWIKYEDFNGNESERKIEIYCPKEDDEYLFAWCCWKQEPRTFNRNKIIIWQILNEFFEFNPLVEQYFKEEGSRDWQQKIPWVRWKERR